MKLQEFYCLNFLEVFKLENLSILQSTLEKINFKSIREKWNAQIQFYVVSIHNKNFFKLIDGRRKFWIAGLQGQTECCFSKTVDVSCS